MNIKELKERVKTLGFETDEEMTEMIDVFVQSVNTAINDIAVSFPVIAEEKIKFDKSDNKIRFDLHELKNYIDLVEILTEDEEFRDYEVKHNKVIFDNKKEKELVFVYEKLPNQITKDTPSETEIELDLIAHELVPLLTSYHMWLDDDSRKATQYYNLYEARRDKIKENMKGQNTIEFIGGI